MWLVAIYNAAEAVGYVLTCPETSIQHRNHSGLGPYHHLELLRLPSRIPGRLNFRSFVESILFVQSPHVTLIAFAYGVTFAITSPGLSTIVPLALEELYAFGPIPQGLFFIGPLVGVVLGELLAGPGSDWAMNRERRQAAGVGHGEHLESRLWVGLPGYVMAIVGVIIFGVTLKTHQHWIAPCIGYAISNFGLQMTTTPLKTYCVDCYPSHSGSVLQFINVIRQVTSFTVPFWSPNLNKAVGYGLGFGIEAIILAAFYSASLLVLWKGSVWRRSIKVRMLA